METVADIVEPIAEPTRLTVELVDTFDRALRNAASWDALLRQYGVDLYMSFEWCRIWWKHYGGHRPLQIFFFWAENELVGVVPMFIDSIGIGPTSVRVAKMVGCDSALTLSSLLVDPRWRAHAVREIVQECITQDRKSVV